MRHFSKLFCFLLAFALAGSANAQLSAGDIAFVSFDSDDPDAFSFLALTTISSGTMIKFTDNGWSSSSGSFRANEGIWKVTFTSDIACGTEILVTAAGPVDLMGNSVGSVSASGSLLLSASGDQILAYQGDETTPSFIAAVNFEGSSWQADATSAATSALPAGLTDGMTAVAVVEVDNAQYSCITESGTKGDLLMAINNAANWLGSDASKQAPAGCLFNPSDCSGGPGGPGGGGDCAELFISEYGEGSAFEKYIEVYNPTAGPVDLAKYELRLYSNGSSTPSTSSLAGGGVLQSGAVMVFKNAQATFGGGVVVSAVNFNGNDAVELYNASTGATADIFGVIGSDPGSAWTAAGGYSTANLTLRRLASVKRGVTVNPSSVLFETLDTEWEIAPINSVDGLGLHLSDCVAAPACLITSVTITPTSGCDDDGTLSQDDDEYTAKVEVAVTNPPGSGDLELYGPEGFIAEVSASSITGGTVVFYNVELPANGLPVTVTASFTVEDCSKDGVADPVYPCSLPDCTPVINELDYNNPGTDDREFVELYNPCSQPINLGDYSVIFVNGANGQIYGDFQLPSVMLAPGDFFVICGDGANTPNCDLDVSPNTNLIQNGNPDAVALLYVQSIADAVSYGGSTTGFTEGSGDGLFDLAGPFLGIGRYVDGVDTDQNNVDFSIQCITPGEPNTSESQYCSLPDDIVVTPVNCGGFNDASYDETSDTYTISSACAHLFGGQDQVLIVGKDACGYNSEVTARITSVLPSFGYGGITMRESDAAGARKMSIIRYANGRKFVEYRPYENGPYYQYWLPSFTLYTDYLRITRYGDYFLAAVSFDGSYWMTIYQQYMGGMPDCVKAGMVVSSYFDGIITQASFQGFEVTGAGAAPRPVGPATTVNSDTPVSFNVFPNPVVNDLSVTIGNAPAEEATITILSLDGREMYRGVHAIDGSTVNLQLSGLQMTAGMYILTANTGKEILTKRFVKANP